MSGHFTEVCEFGKKHGTCRCPSKDKSVINVPCDRPEKHKPELISSPYVEQFEQTERIKPLYDRLRETVDRFFGNMIMPMVGDVFAEHLENEVSQWLRDNKDAL